jgi:hypothetical protein
MSNPLTSNQHGYVKRALQAFETVAESLERIAAALETRSGDSDTSDVWLGRPITEIESGRRYDVLAIDGVKEQSVAIDYSQEPPELRVWANDVHQPTPEDGEHPTHVLELPAAKSSGGEN